jgi:hypothetical protein
MARARVTFTPILPKHKFDAKVYIDHWEDAMRTEVKPSLQKLFKKTVVGWDHKPVFRGTINKSTEFLRLLVKPVGKNAELYAMIDVTGAKKHVINAHPNNFLFYRPGYTSSTRPGRIQSRRKRRSGPIVTARTVKHPGFKAREFSATIAKEYQGEYGQVMKDATHEANLVAKRRFFQRGTPFSNLRD